MAKVKVVDGKVKINGANVVKTDIACTNGVIHVIDAVILPADQVSKFIRVPRVVAPSRRPTRCLRSGVVISTVSRDLRISVGCLRSDGRSLRYKASRAFRSIGTS